MNPRFTRWPYVTFLAFACAGAVVYRWVAVPAIAQSQVREISISGNQFAFAPATIEVQKDDLVKITFSSVDMAHSFTVDSYRIAKRAGAGQTVVFEFRADQPGHFPFYCNLTQDDRCKQMRGELVVR